MGKDRIDGNNRCDTVIEWPQDEASLDALLRECYQPKFVPIEAPADTYTPPPERQALLKEIPEIDSYQTKLADLQQGYKASEGNKGERGKVMSEIVEFAARASHLKEYRDRVDEAAKGIHEAEVRLGTAAIRQQRAMRTGICHGGAKESDFYHMTASGFDAYRAERDLGNKVEKKQAVALARFERIVSEVVNGKLLASYEGEPSVPHELEYLMAQKLEDLGLNERAIEHYNKAAATVARQEYNAVQSMAYRLEALRVAAALRPGEIENKILPEIQRIQNGIPAMMAGAMEGQLLASAGEELSPIYGTMESLNLLNINTLRVKYIAVLGLLSRPNNTEESTEQFTLMRMQAEDEIRAEMASKVGTRSYREAEALLALFQNVVNIWTSAGGVLEQMYGPEQDVDVGMSFYDQLTKDLSVAGALAAPFMEDALPGDPIYERMATLEWQVNFDGLRSIDLPSTGLKNLDLVIIPKYPNSKSIASHLDELRQETRSLGIEDYYFDQEGALRSDINISRLPEGIAAGDRTRAAFMQPNSIVRFIGAPLLGGVTAYGIAEVAGLTNPYVLGVVSLAGAVFGTSTNYVYDTRVRASVAYEESVKSGLSRISEKTAWSYRKGYYLNAALMTLPTAFIKTAGLGLAGTGQWLLNGGKGAISFVKDAALSVGRSDFAATVGRGARGFANFWAEGAKLAGNGLSRISLPGRAAVIGGSAAIGADYGFIDADYNFKFGDGKVDTAVGMIGKAMLMAELYYQIFRLTWRTGSVEVAGKTYTGFADLVNNSAGQWIKYPVRLGANLMTADKYLFKLDSHGDPVMVDFDAPRYTLAEKLADDKQYQIDTAIGYGGMGMFLLPWAINEVMNLPMAIADPKRAQYAKYRVALGGGLLASDYIEDGEFNQWYLGGLGAALLANEAIGLTLGIDPAGSLASTGYRVVWEWLNQYVQDQPLQAPDASRLWLASTESNVMRLFNKGFVLGRRSFQKFPLGQRLMAAQKCMEASPWLPMRLLSKVRSLEGMAEKPVLMPGTNAFKAVKMPAEPSTKVVLKYGSDGRPLETPLEMRVTSQPGMFSKNSPARFIIGEEEYSVLITSAEGDSLKMADLIIGPNGMASPPIKELLQHNGIFANSGALYKVTPQYRGFVRMRTPTKQSVTPESFQQLSRTEQEAMQARLNAEDIYWDPATQKFYRLRMRDPNAPYAFSSHGGYSGSRVSTETQKVMRVDVNGKGTKVWLHLPREKEYFNEAVTIGGNKVDLFHGSLMSPQVNGAGILYNIATIPTTSYLLNRFIFAPTMDGDPSYQAMTRWTHYFLCESFVHPFVMWPMGFDNFKAQTVGRAILTPFVVAEAKLFPSYLDSWPGFRLYNRRLFGVEDDETGSWTVDNSVGAAQAVSSAIRFWEWDEEIDTNSAMDIFENGMTSAQVDPVFGIWGTSEDSTIYFEDRAIETYSAEEGCVRDVMLKGVNIEKSRECREMHPRMQKDLKKELPYWQEIAKEQNLTMKELYQERAENLAANFTNWMEAERKGIVQPEGYARLGTARRRTLVLVAAYIKNDVDAANGPKGSEAEREALRPYADLMERYSCLFDKIPNLDAPGKWDDFIDEVNKGTSPALRFSLDFEVTRE